MIHCIIDLVKYEKGILYCMSDFYLQSSIKNYVLFIVCEILSYFRISQFVSTRYVRNVKLTT